MGKSPNSDGTKKAQTYPVKDRGKPRPAGAARMSQARSVAPTTSTTDAGNTRRLRGLDGIRALAATAVLAYHLFPRDVKGGFLGVDVFFVLSGFLITALLVKEHEQNGKLAIGRFWLRRIRRLLPAVVLMAVVTLLVAGFLSNDLLVGIPMQFTGAVTFVYNWTEIWRGGSYFDHASPRLWTNVWSLAVEQQFYLIWPLVVAALMRLRSELRPIVSAILAAISSLWMAYLISGADDFTRAYQGSDSHAFGLMLGATIAFLAPHALTAKASRLGWVDAFFRGVLAWLGLAVIMVGWWMIPDNQTWVFPWGTLMACIATLAVVQGLLPSVDARTGPGRALAAILDIGPLRYIGERSYGIYLWHWPVWVIVTHELPRLSATWVAVIVISISVTAAALSYRFVEVPMRYHGIFNTLKKWIGRPWAIEAPQNHFTSWLRLLAPIGIGIVVVGTLAGMIASAPEQTSAQRAVEAGRQALTSNAPSKPPASTAPTPTPSSTAQKPTLPAPTGENVTVIGDSVTVASSPALQQVLPRVTIDAEVSRSIIAGTKILRGQLESGTCRTYVVLGLTTNSMLSHDQLNEVLDLIGPQRRLVLVTGFGPKRDDWIFNSNNLIHEFAKAHPENVRIADWANAIKDKTEHLASDYVHPDQEGGAIYASVVKKALEDFE